MDAQDDEPIETYKKIIDELVAHSKSVHARLVREEARFSKASRSDEKNAFVNELTKEQRGVLADMLNDERAGAIHDVLATVTWWIRCRNVRLQHNGQEMPVDLSAMGLHGDFIGRLDDWEWPE
jgi:hypothetical protein